MVAVTDRCSIKWLEPSPLWGDVSRWVRLPRQIQVPNPMILRFADDDFMEELLAVLAQCPYRLSEWEARQETWRDPMPSPDPVLKTRPAASRKRLYNGSKLILNNLSPAVRNELTPDVDLSQGIRASLDPQSPIKLYQAAQNRYYLVAASLTSEEKSYPDYKLNLSANERAFFVVRAVVDSQDKDKHGEYGYVVTPGGKAWKKVSTRNASHVDNQRLLINEERHALFPLHYPDRCDRQRQILAGLIPVGKREEWVGAAQSGSDLNAGIAHPVPSSEGGSRHLPEIFYADVVEPWRALMEQSHYLSASLPADPAAGALSVEVRQDRARCLKAARDQIQTGSWYVLLGFAGFLENYLPNVWSTLSGGQPPSPVTPSEQGMVDLLRQTVLPADYFAALAIDHYCAANYAIEKETLWDELTDLWKLEDKLKWSDWPQSSREIPAAVQNRIYGEEFDQDERQLFERLKTLIRSGTWFTLLDMAHYLNLHVPKLKNAALGKISMGRLSRDETDCMTRLAKCRRSDLNDLRPAVAVADLSRKRICIKHTLADALVAVKVFEGNLNALTSPFDRSPPPAEAIQSPVIDPAWPDFLFPLADPDTQLARDDSAVVPPLTVSTEDRQALEIQVARIDALADQIGALLPAPAIAPQRETGIERTPLLDYHGARFVIRCVFERPQCGSLFPPLVSKASRIFAIAPFFDPDAPARPVRIPLPMDISPSGLRKYKKNAVFLISDMLCGKISKIKKMTLGDLVLSVLPWPFHKDLPKPGPTGPCKNEQGDLGMFCSLSIPIVTLCALILMIIMVKLFDFIFRWFPYLFVCLPIPGFKGKEDG